MRSILVAVLLAACSTPASTVDRGSSAARVPPPAASSAPPVEPATPPRRSPPSPAEVQARIERDCPTVTGPYFFSVEKNGKVSHLLGTRHVSVAFAKFPAAVHETLGRAKHVIFETDPDEPDTNQPPQAKRSLKDQLGQDLWLRLAQLLGPERASFVENQSPAVAFVLLLALNEDFNTRLDEQIIQTVQKNMVPADGLETHEFQSTLLDKLLDLRMLKATIATTDAGRLTDDASTELREYCAGTDQTPGIDPVARAQLEKQGYSAKELDELDELLVYGRNRDWIPKLERHFATPNTMIVVGAGHLIGAKGVPALLEARGYKVTRLR